MKYRKSFLIILDGWGLGKDPSVDAIQLADTPFYDKLMKEYSNDTLITYGEDVGLPEGQMGNSEVGHLNIGAGRIVDQELVRINKACRDNTLIENKQVRDMVAYAQKEKKAVHLMGLVSDGGVHSHINHLKSIITSLDEAGITEVYVHAFMDGRDTAPDGGKRYMQELVDHCKGKSAEIATIIGRYYAMDRDNRYERIKLAYDLLVHGQGRKATDPVKAIEASYEDGKMDEFILPICLQKDGKDIAHMQEKDVVWFYNFRTDRPRQLTTALTQRDFPEYEMKKFDLRFYTMTTYDKKFSDVQVIFTKDVLQKTLGEVIADHDLSQLRIAETEKYPHVTFFFNGGREEVFTNENRIMVPSPKVATYDLKPEMSANEITEAVVQNIEDETPDFICLNFANTDMVGHTGDLQAAIKATEVVDKCLEDVVKKALEKEYEIIVIADHGNSDIMRNPDGSPHTAHTTNLVPIIYVSNNPKGEIHHGKLGDVAPTLLHLMGIEKDTLMTGNSLIKI